MASAIGPGDWVECVDASPDRVTGEPPPFQLRAVLCVSEVTAPDIIGDVGLRFVGVPLAPGQMECGTGWHIDRFRPIYRPKSEIIEALKQPAPPVFEEA